MKKIRITQIVGMTGEGYPIPVFESGKPVLEVLKGPDGKQVATNRQATTPSTSPVAVLENFIIRGIKIDNEGVIQANKAYGALAKAKVDGAKFIEFEDDTYTWLFNKVTSDQGIEFFAYNQSHIKAYMETFEKETTEKK